MVQQGKLEADVAGTDGDDCGVSVAGSGGGLALVGVDMGLEAGPGGDNAVYVFAAGEDDVWRRQAKLSAAAAAAEAADRFGSGVALSGSLALVGASGSSASGGRLGSAYVFDGSSGAWSQSARLVGNGTAPGDAFGYSVALANGSRVLALVGAPGQNASAGAAYVFAEAGGAWSQEAMLLPGDAAASDHFGYSVALSDDFALVGAPYHNGQRGAAFLFSRNSSGWTYEAKFLASRPAAGDQFGCSVAVSGGLAVVGALGHSAGVGTAFVFARQDSTTSDGRAILGASGNSGENLVAGATSVWWQEAELFADNGAVGSLFGASVAIRGSSAVVGAPGAAGGAASRGGAAYFFARAADGAWSQAATPLEAEDAFSEQRLGHSIALAGEGVVVGACRLDASDEHAAYVFARAQCDERHCGEGLVLKVAPPAHCAGAACTEEECCDPAGVCAASDCGNSSMLSAAPPPFCLGASCSEAECCEPLGACSAAPCGAGYALVASPPELCAGTVCTQEECCEPLGVCTAEDCGGADQLLKVRPPVFCSGPSCRAEECCDSAGTCSGAPEDCGDEHVPKMFPPIYCSNTSCTIDECCEPLGACALRICLDDWVLKADVPRYCEGTGCRMEECCSPLANCSSISCGDGLAPKLAHPAKCAGTRCFRWECCDEVFGSCGSTRCAEGSVPKMRPPAACQSPECTQAECCGPPDVCSLTDCSEGWVFRTLAAVNCSRTECAQDECCDQVLDEAGGFTLLPQVVAFGSAAVSLALGAVLVFLVMELRRQARLRKVRPAPPQSGETPPSSPPGGGQMLESPRKPRQERIVGELDVSPEGQASGRPRTPGTPTRLV